VEVREPVTSNHLVIEGAGGLLVPLNNKDTIMDLIRPHYAVVLVSRDYLGSINHTLLSLEHLKQNGLKPWVLFNGNENRASEQIILQKTGIPLLGRIAEEKNIDKELVRAYARQLLPALKLL